MYRCLITVLILFSKEREEVEDTSRLYFPIKTNKMVFLEGIFLSTGTGACRNDRFCVKRTTEITVVESVEKPPRTRLGEWFKSKGCPVVFAYLRNVYKSDKVDGSGRCRKRFVPFGVHSTFIRFRMQFFFILSKVQVS